MEVGSAAGTEQISYWRAHSFSHDLLATLQFAIQRVSFQLPGSPSDRLTPTHTYHGHRFYIRGFLCTLYNLKLDVKSELNWKRTRTGVWVERWAATTLRAKKNSNGTSKENGRKKLIMRNKFAKVVRYVREFFLAVLGKLEWIVWWMRRS